MDVSVATAVGLSIAERTRRRIVARLIPFLFILYIINYLDRVNISYAKLQMAPALGFSEAVFGFGAGIFFFGYFLLEIPGTLIVERWSARKWIARIMISWGIVATLMGFIQNATQFYWLRLILGAAEAGFFPGIIVYLSHWFRYEDRGKAVALFMSALPVSNLIGSPMSGLLLGVNWWGLAGWRWLFIIEGIPAVILGFITLCYLTDWPHEAKWLPKDEQQWLSAELEREKEARKAARPLSILQAFKQPAVWLMVIIYFLALCGFYSFTFWLPTLIKQWSGMSDLKVTLFAMIPYTVGLVSMLTMGWSSDRSGERRWHSACSLIAAGIGFVLVAMTGHQLAMVIATFCLVSAGGHAFFPSFWAMPTAFLTEAAAAATIGLINSFGNLGGTVGGYVIGYLKTTTGSFESGVLCSAGAMIAAGLLIFVIRPRHVSVSSSTSD